MQPDALKLRKRIFAGCKEIGLDDDGRRDLVQLATGKPSMKAMGTADLKKVEDALRERGWKPKARPGKGRRWRTKSPRADIRKIHVLWRLLAEAGVMKAGDTALNAFINSTKFAAKWGHAPRDVDMLPSEMASDVIEALKDICSRNGVEFER